MKAVPIKEAEGQLGKLIAEAYQGEVIVFTDGDRKVTLAPATGLDLDEDSPELEAELLKAVNGPHSPWREGELREIADQALREHRAGHHESEFTPYSSDEMRAACEKIVREKRG